MIILRSQNKITDFLMILAWASPFKQRIYPRCGKYVCSVGFSVDFPVNMVTYHCRKLMCIISLDSRDIVYIVSLTL